MSRVIKPRVTETDKKAVQIGERMREARFSRCLSLREVADYAQVSHTLVRLWEIGDARMRDTYLSLVAQALGVDLDFLQNGVADQPAFLRSLTRARKAAEFLTASEHVALLKEELAHHEQRTGAYRERRAAVEANREIVRFNRQAAARKVAANEAEKRRQPPTAPATQMLPRSQRRLWDCLSCGRPNTVGGQCVMCAGG